MQTILIQTLQDKGNPNQVENEGPFKCKHKTAWLGIGYYFWDTHLKLGHWWGKTVHKGEYIICTADAVIDDTCWDLHNNQNHVIEFREAIEAMEKGGVAKRENLLVPYVIEYLREKGFLKYKAIRALGNNSISYRDSEYVYRVLYHEKNYAFLDLYPPIQVCLFEKNALNLRNFKIVFPLSYRDQEYV